MKMPSVQHCLGPNVYPEVPDGRWGWAVAFAFFLVEVCTYGVIKSLGVFLQDLMEEFGESNSRVSWVISICVFIFAFTAPLSTMLSNHFGYRPVVMMGGLLISIGTITSAFTSSITEMYITTGIISGLGYCFTFLPTLTILAQYFSRRRALVTSIASSGESVAVFVFAPGVLVDVTDNYGAAFYSCAAGMGLSAICLALVGPAKSGVCQRVSRDQEKGENIEGEEKMSQNSDQSDFLEVDLAPEDSPVGQAEDQDDSCVI